MENGVPDKFELSPSQGVQLMALAEMLRDQDLAIRGDEDEDIEAAYSLLSDVAQEIALQVSHETNS